MGKQKGRIGEGGTEKRQEGREGEGGRRAGGGRGETEKKGRRG